SSDRFNEVRAVYVGTSQETGTLLEIEEVINRNKGILLKFASIDDRTTAEALRDKLLFVEEDKLLAPQKGSFFVHDIIGCEVWSDDEKFLGRVEEINKFPAQDIWVIRNELRAFMVPAVKQFIRSVDTKNRKIIVHLIAGLIEE